MLDVFILLCCFALICLKAGGFLLLPWWVVLTPLVVTVVLMCIGIIAVVKLASDPRRPGFWG